MWQTNALPLSSGAVLAPGGIVMAEWVVAKLVEGNAEEANAEEAAAGAAPTAAPAEEADGAVPAGGSRQAGGHSPSTAARSMASEEAGVFATIARANHSCMPCARYEWDAEAGEMRLLAMDQIPAGAEVTISYSAAFPPPTSYLFTPYLLLPTCYLLAAGDHLLRRHLLGRPARLPRARG